MRTEAVCARACVSLVVHLTDGNTFSKAEHRYLLSATGQTKRALFLIISSLGDVSYAIAYVKEQADEDLWNDLLDYSKDKPRLILALLEEVGTAINPVTLIKRIPKGLEIDGLPDGIRRMMRDFEIQSSISEGAAKVLRSDVATNMEMLRAGQKRGIKFEVASAERRRRRKSIDNKDATKRVNTARDGTAAAAADKGSIFEHDDRYLSGGMEPAKAGQAAAAPAVRPGQCVVCGDFYSDEGKHGSLFLHGCETPCDLTLFYYYSKYSNCDEECCIYLYMRVFRQC